MPEMKNSFQKGRMNKDLDERIVPQGEYRDALNVEISTSEGSSVGTLQTIKGNSYLEGQPWGDSGVCIGSIANNRNDKLYFMIAKFDVDLVVEYDHFSSSFSPVCVDNHFGGIRVLNFNKQFLITGINVIDDTIYWTDNNSEPKRVNITRGKAGSTIGGVPNYFTTTKLMVKNPSDPSQLINALDDSGASIEILEKHLTVIKKAPPGPPVLEMIDTEKQDIDGDGQVGGYEIRRSMTLTSPEWLDTFGDFIPNINISVGTDADGDGTGTDFSSGDYILVYAVNDPSVKVRLLINTSAASGVNYTCTYISGDKDITAFDDYEVMLEQPDALFEFKLARFGCRYKYTDGEYSTFSSFTQPAFLPGTFNYMPKEGYNLGMVNRLRKLAVKNFVSTRQMPEDVVAIDILYKESNSTNIYSVTTIKRRVPNNNKWDEWNAVSPTSIILGSTSVGDGWRDKIKGYLPITSEMIHAILPANQLLRPWDNVPRMALAQEVVGNRLVYGNYLQNYNLSNSGVVDKNIKVDLKVVITSARLGGLSPEEIQAPSGGFIGNNKGYSPTKSLKTLRTYQLGVVYIDKYGRETPVFSQDKRGLSGTELGTSSASVYNKKTNSASRNSLTGTLQNKPPDWATHFKYFVKETSNEYYNLAMDRWYNAEDGNIWLSFPSAERNKIDEETFLILKKAHNSNTPITEKARYKVLAISNEAPRFIKLQNIFIGSITDDGTLLGNGATGFPLPNEVFIIVDSTAFANAGWNVKLIDESISQTYMRVRNSSAVSRWYEIKAVEKLASGDYRIKSKETFKADMSHTSLDGTIGTALATNILDIARRREQDKAEFDGRFFAKILKDGTIIQHLGVTSSASLIYVTSNAMPVQYIDPDAEPAPTLEQFFGKQKNGISVSSHNYRHPSGARNNPGNNGSGQDYWKLAGNSDGAHVSLNGNTSSGWFIDHVEGYRPFKGKSGLPFSSNGNVASPNHSQTYQSLRWETEMPDNLSFFPGWVTMPGGADWSPVHNTLNALGTNTHNDSISGTNYLSGSQLIRTPDESLRTAGAADGGHIGPSSGIDATASIISISYAGTNGTDTGIWSDGYDSNSSFASLSNHYFDGVNNAVDIEFITKLTTPGTLWTWAEDPGKVVYRTIANLGLGGATSPYTSNQWNAEKNDIVDGSPGTLLFNYAVFADYVITSHYEQVHWYWVDPFGGVWGEEKKFPTKLDWQSRLISNGYHNPSFITGWIVWAAWKLEYSPWYHDSIESAKLHNGLPFFGGITWDMSNPLHHSFPNGIYEWNHFANKRRRFTFKAEVAFGPNAGNPVGSEGPHFYLPTNDCTLPPHFNYDASVLTADPNTGIDFDVAGTVAPGIRPDGMYAGYDITSHTWNNGSFADTVSEIGLRRRWQFGLGTQVPQEVQAIPGSVTWQIKEPFVEEADGSAVYSSTNPAIWETEPKEDLGLDIYSEIGQTYPIYLDDDTIEQFVGAIGSDISKNSFVQCWDGPPPMGGGTGTIILDTNVGSPSSSQDIRVSAAYSRFVQLSDASGVVLDSTAGHTMPTIGAYLIFQRADGGTTEAHVGASTYVDFMAGGTWFELTGATTDVGVHNKMVTLPWFNCYSFGNGVESDRIRDDFNQITIDNGPKVSTTIEGQYVEDRRENGFIWSGIYNSTSGVNNLNQFIQAEAITKDINPSYGSIQKLSVRDSDLVAFCEDRVLKVLADKDALFNADGNTNLVATNRVLGSVKPFVGDYGISKNPESFAQDSYRSYFSDISRGVIVRLSQDGLTPISNAGMKDWFADNLPNYSNLLEARIIGSFDDKKQEYNVTLNPNWAKVSYPPLVAYGPPPPGPPGITLSYSEPSKGWVSFKSFIQENGVSLNNNYYTFKGGKLYEHHVNEVRNNFYLDPSVSAMTINPQYDSYVDVLFNQQPSVIKSFATLNYEGSQSKVTQDIINNPDYYDDIAKEGWYISKMSSKQIIDSLQDGQELGPMEFWDKEDKWFSQIKGVTTEWLNDGTAGNIDPREFSYQGIGNANVILCPTCPPTDPGWNCVPAQPAVLAVQGVTGSPAIPGYYTGATIGVPGYYINPTLGVPGYYTLASSNCDDAGLVFDNSFGGPYSSLQDANAHVSSVSFSTNPPTNPNVDVSATQFDVDSAWFTANPVPGPDPVTGIINPFTPLDPSTFCPGTLPNTYAAHYSSNGWQSPGLISGSTVGTGQISIVQSTYAIDAASIGNAIIQGFNAWQINGAPHPSCITEIMNTSVSGIVTSSTPVGFQPGYNSWSGLMADVAAQYPVPSVGNPIALSANMSGSDLEDYMEWEFYLAQGPNPTLGMSIVICANNISPCICSGVYVDPVLPTLGTWIPPVLATLGTWIPPVLAVTAVTAVPATPATLAGCVPAAGGSYPTLAACEIDCTPIVPSWDCETATSTVYPFLPISYCVDPLDGSGAYTTLASCDINCLTPPIPLSWECINGVCVDPGNGLGPYTSLNACDIACNPLGTWDCTATGCVDPGTGLGQYSTIGACNIVCNPPSWDCINSVCIDPGTGLGQYTDLATCNSLCNPITLGGCDIQGALPWNINDTYAAGVVVSWLGSYYHNTNAVAIPPNGGMSSGTLSPDINNGSLVMFPGFPPLNGWTECLPTSYIGSCNITNSSVWDSSVQDGTVAWSDGSFGYDANDVTSVTWASGSTSYFYTSADISLASVFQPGGLAFSAAPLPYGQLNPWIDCSAPNPSMFADCDVSNYEVWNPSKDYQVGIHDNSPTPLDPHWAVLHNGVYWILGCGQTMTTGPGSAIDFLLFGGTGCSNYSWENPNPWGYGYGTSSGSSVLGCDGTVDDPGLPLNASGGDLGDDIINGTQDCIFGDGINPISTAGVEPGNPLLDPYSLWVPCVPLYLGGVTYSCCDDSLFDGGFSTLGGFDGPCWSSWSCICNPSFCTSGSCFSEGDKVEMFDGTKKAIELIKTGDEVKSVKNNSIVKGIVTELLIHPTNDVVEVVKMKGITSEPNHPVLVNNEWVAIKTLGNISNQFIGNWYNLEIDGSTSDSEHNYIIEGLTVSGLGDNIKLNNKYQRQPKELTKYLND